MKTSDTRRQIDFRRYPLDGSFPFVARHVPVELVVGIEESQRVKYAIAEDDRAGRVVGVGNIDFEFYVASLPASLVLERLAGVLCDTERFEKQRVGEPCGCYVLDRDRAVDAVPIRADELRFDGLSDFDRAVGTYYNLFVEMLDDDLPRRQREWDEQCQQETNNGTTQDGPGADSARAVPAISGLSLRAKHNLRRMSGAFDFSSILVWAWRQVKRRRGDWIS